MYATNVEEEATSHLNVLHQTLFDNIPRTRVKTALEAEVERKEVPPSQRTTRIRKLDHRRLREKEVLRRKVDMTSTQLPSNS